MYTFGYDILVDTFIFDGRRTTGEYTRCNKLSIAYREDAKTEDIFKMAVEKICEYCNENDIILLSVCKLERGDK